MTSRRLLGTLVTVSVAGTFLVVPASAAEPSEGLGSRFSIGVLPDSQFYSRYSTLKPAIWPRRAMAVSLLRRRSSGW